MGSGVQNEERIESMLVVRERGEVRCKSVKENDLFLMH